MRVGIVGGGASGVLAAVHIGRATPEPVEIVIVEPRTALGEGIAYSTSYSAHLLNVRAAGMSAFPDDADHFRMWAGCQPHDYLARRDYAQYLRDVLAKSPAEATHVRAEVTAVNRSDSGFLMSHTAGHESVDALIIATGNETPALPAGVDISALAPQHGPDISWTTPRARSHTSGHVHTSDQGDRVLIIGSGLTAVDLAVSTLNANENSSVVMLSRHGWLPQAHDEGGPRTIPPIVTPDDVVAGIPMWTAVAALAKESSDWRAAVDGLRPVTQALWRSMSEGQRDQFRRHLLRRWDVHRHRMAPAVAQAIANSVAQGRLSVEAATITSLASSAKGIVLSAEDGRQWLGDSVVLATGPEPSCTANPLLRQLVASGLAIEGPLGWGIAVDADTRVIGADGTPVPRLWALGPPTRGSLFESTAVPDIRVHASRIGQQLAVRDVVLT